MFSFSEVRLVMEIVNFLQKTEHYVVFLNNLPLKLRFGDARNGSKRLPLVGVLQSGLLLFKGVAILIHI